jgi:genome maintenance exonuclease 1
MFIHESLDWNDLDSVQEDGKRFYLTPSGKKYPSMTTVLQLMTAEGIAKWRARVGDEVANKVSAQASRRGTLMHKLCEDYVNNEEIDTESLMPLDLQNFNALKEQMDKHFGKVYGQEIALYSDFLEMAGRVDCIAEYKGKLSIIDYKTSKKVKKRSNIKNYFMQAAGYAVMFEEIFKKPINNLVILMSVDHEGVVEFVEKRDDHIHDLIELRKKYKEKNNI